MSRGLLVVEKDDSLFDSNIQTECDVAELLNNESSQRRNLRSTSSAVRDAPKCTIPKHPLYSVEDIKKSTKATSHPLF